MSNNLNQGASEAALLPCPFCASNDIAHEIFPNDDSRDFVMCNGCGVFAQRNDCDAEPVEVWNRRTPAATTGAAPNDTDENAPWLTSAHIICADAGIPPGEITWRLEVLRGLMEADRAEIADLRAQLAAAQVDAERVRIEAYKVGCRDGAAPASAQPADPGLFMDEATRLRRVVNLLGIQHQVPGNDASLRECLFSVLGLIARKLEAGAQPDQLESAAAVPADGIITPEDVALYRDNAFAMYASDDASPAAQPAKDEQTEPSPMYFDAVKIVKEAQRASVSLVQRRLRISWDAARDMIELMLSRRDVPIEWAPPVYQLNMRQNSANNGADKQKGGANG